MARPNPNEPVHLVWFKRDLRIEDHRPLTEAAARGPVLCLYLYEPELLMSAEFAGRHLLFVNEALFELSDRIARLGSMLVIRRGEAVEELHRLSKECRIAALWSHEETGNRITYHRDLRVQAWCHAQGIEWHEYRQDGVVRRLRDRNGWSRRWNGLMDQPILPPPEALKPAARLGSVGILAPESLGLAPDPFQERQAGGSNAAWETLHSFLDRRGVNYRRDMSSPVTGWEGCSRLSPHLAWGCLSLRSVHQATRERQADLHVARMGGHAFDSRWSASLRSFQGRLRWHCHFMQKLEDEPALEFQNLCRAYDGLREDDFNEEWFDAWKSGQTGYPMVDACMRAVAATGWLNFRMRAMVVSFASYHLWLHWRRTGMHLGRAFLDFEPGIHYSQMQMQSGTTGINTIRIYSPAKQAADQDPTGAFIRRWVPELEAVPDARLVEPHRMSLSEQDHHGCRIGKDYPAPIVEHAVAYREAKRRLMAVRSLPETRAAAREVVAKHGSRRSSAHRRSRGRRTDPAQLSLF